MMVLGFTWVAVIGLRPTSREPGGLVMNPDRYDFALQYWII